MSNPWDDLAQQVPDEAPVFEDLPKDAWLIARTATTDNGNASPRVETIEGKKEPGTTFHKFNIGLLCAGGDKRILPSHRNKMVFLDAFIAKGAKEEHKGPISGRLTGFLNAAISGHIGLDLAPDKKDSRDAAKVKREQRNAARWQNTIEVLKTAAEENDIALEAYDGDFARMIAGTAAIYLSQNPATILVKTRGDKWQDKVYIKAGAVEDYTAANVANRKCELMEGFDDLDAPFTSAGVSF